MPSTVRFGQLVLLEQPILTYQHDFSICFPGKTQYLRDWKCLQTYWLLRQPPKDMETLQHMGLQPSFEDKCPFFIMHSMHLAFPDLEQVQLPEWQELGIYNLFLLRRCGFAFCLQLDLESGSVRYLNLTCSEGFCCFFFSCKLDWNFRNRWAGEGFVGECKLMGRRAMVRC